MISFLFRQEPLIAGILLAVAFILTFWRRRPLFWFAAGFYCAGAVISIGYKVSLWFFSIWLVYGLSDSGLPSRAILAGLPTPSLASVYGIASVILIWPWISQKNALRIGKVLHLIILPMLVSIIFVGAFVTPGRSQAWLDLQWLVYGPLWFRIRESWLTRGEMR